jgi:hypothetical protein
MNGAFSVYTRNPTASGPEGVAVPVCRRTQRSEREETEIARKVRKRLYEKYEGMDEKAKPRGLTKLDQQKKAREQVLTKLRESDFVDIQGIKNMLTAWAKDDLGLQDQVVHPIFDKATVKTESLPAQGIFRIRVQL